MDNEKINQSELVNRLAARAEFSTKAEAVRFVAALEQVFQDKLLADRLVKLGGIGTFRLQWVEPRKSVDVRTGESIEIAGHYRLAFVPDAALKTAVNSEAVAPEMPKEAPLQKLSEQAIEIKDMLSEINAPTDDAPQSELESEPEQPQIEPEQPQPESPVAAEPDPTPEPILPPEPDPIPAPEPEPMPQPEPTPQPELVTPAPRTEQMEMLRKVVDNVVAQPEPPKRKSLAWLWTLLIVLLLCGGGFAAYYFYGDVIRTWCEPRWQSLTTLCSDTWQSWFGTADDEMTENDTSSPILSDDEPTDATETSAEAESDDIFTQPRTYTSFIGRERIEKGVHLAIIAEKHYGHKDFWVYIYEANRNVIANPNAVEVGTVVRLPKMDARLVDANNPEAVAFAQQLAARYLQ